jgi:hypothetical protein
MGAFGKSFATPETLPANGESARTRPEHPDLNRPVHAAIARHSSRRGWRIDRPNGGETVDGVIALAMALDRAEQPAQTVEFLGWL